MFKKTLASKEQVSLMVALAGTAGSGKTYSALQLAYGITGDWTKITIADTENRSAMYYAGDRTGPWEHVDFPPTMRDGYHPANWVKLIKFVESDPKTEVLILDSISHEWAGCLELVDQIKGGNSFTAWKTVTPLHTAFIDAMRNSRLHIIATMRTASEFALEKNEKTGKTTPKKIGTKVTQREGTDYEFGIIFDLDIETHRATASKDRTGLFADRTPFLITADLGKELVSWAKSGTVRHTTDDVSSRLAAAVAWFAGKNVTETMLVQYLGAPPSVWGQLHLQQLGKLVKAVEEGQEWMTIMEGRQ